MATSTFYGWAEPDDSSLVKNGASDIRTLGNAIDTSVWNVGFGQAGKNKIINGNFAIWQRGTSVTVASNYGYGADRWRTYSYGSSTATIAQQTFTPGAAPVAGYEGQYFARFTSTNTTTLVSQPIEDVRTFAGQTATFSFWAKSSSGQTISLGLNQNFGSGGSATVQTSLTSQTITTSWVRYSATVAVPSISGKTIGTSNYLEFFINGAINNALDIWGVQAEYGSKATPFQTATGTIQGELAACQRYYIRNTTGANYGVVASGSAGSTTSSIQTFVFPSQMRVTPTSVEFANLELGDNNTAAAVSALTINTNVCNKTIGAVDASATGLTQFRYYNLRAANNTSAYLAFSAEL